MIHKFHTFGNKPFNKIAKDNVVNFLEVIDFDIDYENLAEKCLAYEDDILKLSKRPVKDFTKTIADSTTIRNISYNILNWPGFDYLKPKIKTVLKSYCDFHDQEFLPTACSAWINIFRNDQNIGPHCHAVGPNSWISGIVCLKSEGTKTVFQNQITKEQWSFSHKNGSALLFPDWIEHWSEHTADLRILLVFDTALEPDIKWKERKDWIWINE